MCASDVVENWDYDDLFSPSEGLGDESGETSTTDAVGLNVNTEGTIFIDPDTVTEENVVPESTSSASVDVAAPVLTWSTAKQLAKPCLFATGKFSVTDTQGETLWAANVEDFTDNMCNLHYAELNHYTYFRGDFLFHVQLTTSQMYCGRLVLFYMPGPANSLTYDWRNYIAFPSVEVDAADSRRVTLRIPWTHIYQKWFLRGGNLTSEKPFSMGSINLAVLAPLRAPVGARNNLAYSIWRSFENAECTMPLSVGTVFIPDDYDHVPAVAQSGGTTDALGAVESAVTAVTGVDVKPFSDLARLGMALLDKPSDPRAAERVWPRQPIRTFGSGPDSSVRLSLNAVAHNPAKKKNVTWSAKGMSLHVLKRVHCVHPTRLAGGGGTFSWNINSTEGIRLWREVVTPCVSSWVDITTKHAEVKTDMLGYVAAAFDQWRGSVEYTFRFVKTHFHMGKVVVIFYPACYGVVPTTLPKCDTSMMTVTLDLSVASDWTVTVPYIAATHSLKNGFLDNSETLSGTTHSLGTIAMYVLNSLTANSSVSGVIDVVVSRAGGPDMEFFCPRAVPVPEWNKDVGYVAQSGTAESFDGGMKNVGKKRVKALTRSSQLKTQSVVLYPEYSPKGYFAKELYGESCMDLRVLLKRYSPLAVMRDFATGVYVHHLVLPVSPNNCFQLADQQTSFLCSNTLNYFAQLFAYWHGSMRYQVYRKTQSGVNDWYTAIHVPRLWTNPAGQTSAWTGTSYAAYQKSDIPIGGMATDALSVSSGSSLMVEVPYLSQYSCLAMTPNDTRTGRFQVEMPAGLKWGMTNVNANGVLMIQIGDGVNDDDKEDGNFYVANAIGDDFTMGMILPPPVFYSERRFLVDPLENFKP